LTDTPDNLRILHTEPDDLLAAIEQIRRMLPLYREMAPDIAQTRYANYRAYVEAGFTEDQALTLCRSLVI